MERPDGIVPSKYQERRIGPKHSPLPAPFGVGHDAPSEGVEEEAVVPGETETADLGAGAEIRHSREPATRPV